MHIFNSSLINDFRAGLTRNVNNEHPEDHGTDWGANLGIPCGTTTNPKLWSSFHISMSVVMTRWAMNDAGAGSRPMSNNYDTNDTFDVEQEASTP